MNPKTENSDQEKMTENQQKTEQKRPDDVGGIHIQGAIKIFDPESNQVFVEKRA